MDGTASRLLCIVVPCFDEEQVIERTYAELDRVLANLDGYRVLLYFVDDGSRDTTLYRLNALSRRDDRVRVIALSRNFGHQAAIAAGLDHADRRADAVLVMDADLENPPALIPRMLEELAHGHDVVMGVRRSDRRVGLSRRLASRGFYWAFNLLSEVPIEPGAPDFFVLSRRAREAVARMPERHRFMRGMVAWIGFSRAVVPYVPPPRGAGTSKYTLARMLRFASDAFFAFSSAPVKLTLWASALFLALGLGGASWALWLASSGRNVQAPLWVSALVSLACGVLLGALGLVGGYLARVFDEVQGRPLYVVKQAPHERAQEPRVLAPRARRG